MTRRELEGVLPHREPMLLLDELAIEKDGSTTGHYRVKGDEYFLSGHFPGNPIVPGVILCEITAQSATGIFINELKGKTPLFTGIDNVRFRVQVRPGDVVETRCVFKRARPPFYAVSGKAFVNGKLAMSGDFSFALV